MALRAILSDLDRVLAPEGAAYIEIGFNQAAAVRQLAADNRFAISFRRDLAGVERVAIVSRQSVPK